MGLNIPPDLNQPSMGHLPGNAGQEHEFDIMQNEVFNGLAFWVGFVGIVLGILGGIYSFFGLLALPMGIMSLAQGICLLMMGIWLWAASRSFKQIVTTEGMDVTLLMHALKKLRAVFTLGGILLMIFIALMIIVLVLAFGVASSGPGMY